MPTPSTVERVIALRRAQQEIEAVLDQKQGHAPDLTDLRETRAIADRFAPLYKDLGLAQPQPRADQTPLEYRAHNLQGLRRWTPKWAGRDVAGFASIGRIDGAILDEVENEIIAAARARADNPTLGRVGAPDELRAVQRKDEHGNLMITHHGSPLSWMRAFMPPIVSCLTAIGPGDGRAFAGEFK